MGCRDGGRLTSLAGQRRLRLLRIEVLMVRDVRKLFSFSAEAELIAFGHPLGLLLTKDVQEPRLCEVGRNRRLKRYQSCDGVGMRAQGSNDGLIDNMLDAGARDSRAGSKDLLRILERTSGGAEHRVRDAQNERNH